MNMCIVDSKGKFIEFAEIVEMDNTLLPVAYTLKDNEKIVNLPYPFEFVKPVTRDGKKWIETATPEEIKAAKPEPLLEQETEQSELEELAMELSEMVATQAEEIAELKAEQEETNDAVMELTNLLS